MLLSLSHASCFSVSSFYGDEVNKRWLSSGRNGEGVKLLFKV